MLHWLADPISYAFMQRSLLASLMVGILCAVIGCYVVLRGMAFMGDALAHAILPGIAIAYLLDGNLLLGALAAAGGVALGGAISSVVCLYLSFYAKFSRYPHYRLRHIKHKTCRYRIKEGRGPLWHFLRA